MQFLRQDETLSLSFASLVMVDYTYKYNIQDLLTEEVHSYSPKKLMYTNSLRKGPQNQICCQILNIFRLFLKTWFFLAYKNLDKLGNQEKY